MTTTKLNTFNKYSRYLVIDDTSLTFSNMLCGNTLRIVIPVIVSLFIAFNTLTPIYAQENPQHTIMFDKGIVKINNLELKVQLAETDEQKTQGLMFQSQLPYDQGMLFLFDKEQTIGIWMMNMQFPLDIIWFDKQGNVIYIQKNAPPCKSVEPSSCPVMGSGVQSSQYVLEVTSGFIDKFNITNSSKLDLTNLRMNQSTLGQQNQNINSSIIPEYPTSVLVLIISIMLLIIMSRKPFFR